MQILTLQTTGRRYQPEHEPLHIFNLTTEVEVGNDVAINISSPSWVVMSRPLMPRIMPRLGGDKVNRGKRSQRKGIEQTYLSLPRFWILNSVCSGRTIRTIELLIFRTYLSFSFVSIHLVPSDVAVISTLHRHTS
jgi:hypothetical protein